MKKDNRDACSAFDPAKLFPVNEQLPAQYFFPSLRNMSLVT
jgi:hypothetical protein